MEVRTDMAAKPLIIGQEISGVALLRLVQDSPHSETREYSVRYLCCGKTATITQRQILERRSRGLTQCHTCATQATSRHNLGRHHVTPFAVGDEVSSVRIDAITVTDTAARKLTYGVTHLCCGHQAALTHQQITDRQRRLVTCCAHCARRTGREPTQAQTTSFYVISELPASMRPKPKISASDIERHIARVFGR